MTSTDRPLRVGAAPPIDEQDDLWFEDDDLFDEGSTWDEMVAQAKRRLRLSMPVELPEDVLAAFAASPEALALVEPRIDAPRIALRLAAQEYDLTLATMQWFDLREVVFDSLGYAQAIRPWDARRFVDEMLAFIRFSIRIGTPPHAAEWLRVFDKYAAEDLADIVAEPDVHHSPRIFLEMGRTAGYDVDTPEGLAAWKHRALSGPPREEPPSSESRGVPLRRALSLAPGQPEQPALRPRSDLRTRRAAARVRKKKRKAAQRARRRNR
jgi:hypothetical protein